MSVFSTSSNSDKCTGKGCRGTVVFTPQLEDLISGPNPNIVKASTMLIPCSKCKNLAISPKEKIVTVLALHGVNTLPKKGIDAITYGPKNVRYKLHGTADDRRYGWQYRCGNDSFDWYNECTNPKCMGMGRIVLSDFFDHLYRAVRSPESSAEANLKELFEMCQHCGYGHPAACGEVQVAELRKEFIMSIMQLCKYGVSCVNAGGSCLMCHGNAEKNKVRARLDAYVASIQRKVQHKTIWGDNDTPLVIGSSEVVSPPATISVPASDFPVLQGKWKSPSMSEVVTAPVSTPAVVTVSTPAVVTAPAVVKSYAEDDTLGIRDVHNKYVADLRARLSRGNVTKADKTKKIQEMNKLIESYRTDIASLDKDSEELSQLISSMSSVFTNESSSKAVKEASPPKKPILSISALNSMPVLDSVSSTVLEETEPIVDVSLSGDDSLSRPLVILPAINA